MPTDPTVTKTLQRFQMIKPKRGVWNQHWQDIKELVRCDTTDFNRQTVPGYKLHDLVYDGTAINANEELASGLHSNLTSPTEKWFEIHIEGGKDLMDDPQVKLWLEFVEDLIYEMYSRPKVCFNTALNESYLDLGAFGTCCPYLEWNDEDNQMIFSTKPLAEFYFMENNLGLIDTVFRNFGWTGRQILQEFGYVPEKLAKLMEKKGGEDNEYKIVQHICPRTDRNASMYDAGNKRFASIYVCEDTMEALYQSGYDSLPYCPSRWVKLAGEVYGRGPAMKCLPDIKSLQVMERTMLKAGQKAVDPPLVLADDGFLLPINTAPGSLIFKETGVENPEPLKFAGDVKFGMEQTAQKRDYINKCFHTDLFRRFKKSREQSATEVLDDRDEMLRMLAPMMGRQQTELLGPMLSRTYQLMHDRGMFPPAPPQIQKKKLKISYISPAARAQQGVVADKMARYMQDLVPMAQIDPSVLDAIDLDKMAKKFAQVRGVPQIIIRSDQDIATRRQDKQKQAMAAQAEPVSKAALNLAKANQANQGGGA